MISVSERADSITKCYGDFMNYARKYEVTVKVIKELKRKLWRALVTVNILEGLFYGHLLVRLHS